MTNTQTTTTKTNHYFRAMVVLAALAMVASLLVASAGRPAHAAPSTFTVNFTGDLADRNPGDGVCDVTSSIEDTCTLRAAIQESNATTTDADTINFNIPAAFRDPASGVATITPRSPLPFITDQVTIDGYTQPGAHPNTKTLGNDAALKIELSGISAPSTSSGLKIETTEGSVIRGLVIYRFGGPGITVSGDSVANRIEGNFIGTDHTGTIDRGNDLAGVSIRVGPSQTLVGGTTPAARNVISGNGIGIDVFQANGSLIMGNYVGTDKSGTKDLGNTDGVEMIGATGGTVGGATAASRNVISGNDNDGIEALVSQGTKVLGNRIGTTASGTGALGNTSQGVHIFGDASHILLGDGTSAGSNTIAFNGSDGIFVVGSSIGNGISRNSIFSNGGLGIDLEGPDEGLFTDVSTPNDPDDADSGANNLQNFPVITSAKTVSGTTTIKGKLDSNPNQTYTIEFYSNPLGTNEGKKFIGKKSVTTSVDGLRSFIFTPAMSVAVGQTITATATRAFTHDTSEFSAPKKVVAS
jgi:hypothetical protein